MAVGSQLVCACLCALLTGAIAEDPDTARFERLIKYEEDHKKQLPLIIQLVRVHDADVIKYYLDHKGTADINATISDGTSAIWHAAQGQKKDVVALLAQYGANLHVQKKEERPYSTDARCYEW
jgi:hypothetical protein